MLSRRFSRVCGSFLVAVCLIGIGIFSSARAVAPSQAQSVEGVGITLPKVTFGTDASLAVAADGTIHVAFNPDGPERLHVYPVQYATCARQCEQEQNWGVVALGNVNDDGGGVRLRLDPQGRPRLMWYDRDFTANEGVYVYAECNQGCLKPSNWTAVALTRSRQYSLRDEEYFTLDATGRPHFFFQNSERVAAYASCQRACIQAANWTVAALITPDFAPYHFQLAVDSKGRPRVSFLTAVRAAEAAVGFAACDANCTNAANWFLLPGLAPVGSVDYNHSLAIDSQGRPRLAVYTGGSPDPTGYDYRLFYLWCDTRCNDGANWLYSQVPVPAHYGENVEIALDRQDQPRLVYYIHNGEGQIYGLGQAWCVAKCTADGARWKNGILMPREFLDLTEPLRGCAWLYVGQHPSFAIDQTGKLHVAYDAEIICSEGSAGRRIRYAVHG